MKLKLDENLPERLVPILAEIGHDVDTVLREGLGGRNDRDLWPEVSDHKVRVRRPRPSQPTPTE